MIKLVAQTLQNRVWLEVLDAWIKVAGQDAGFAVGCTYKQARSAREDSDFLGRPCMAPPSAGKQGHAQCLLRVFRVTASIEINRTVVLYRTGT